MPHPSTRLLLRPLLRTRQRATRSSSSSSSRRPWVSSSRRPPLEPRRPPVPPALLGELVARTREAGTASGLNVVAFSGGVDSSLAAFLVREAFPSNCVAAIGLSAALPERQLGIARGVARSIGIPLEEIETQEGDDPEYVKNTGDSCFYCKSELYSTLSGLANHFGFGEAHGGGGGRSSSGGISSGGGGGSRSVGISSGGGGYDAAPANTPTPSSFSSSSSPSASLSTSAPRPLEEFVLFNGTNADDAVDPTRVGLKAAADFAVVSPLLDLDKATVRDVAREVGLPNWSLAAGKHRRWGSRWI